MLNGPFALALTAGMAATVNPCGFALLPAYLSAFVGLDDSNSRSTAVGRGLKVSLVLTAGFVLVFGVMGLIITQFISSVQEYLPWATIVIGIGLVGLGVYLLTGRQLVLSIPKLQKGGADGTIFSMFLFGVSYAVASLSCTIGPFLAVTSTTFRNENYLSGVMVFVLYGLGMGVVVSVLTLAVALAKDGLVNKFRALLPKMNKIAGVFLVVAGAYVAYYGYFEVRLFFFDGPVDDPIVGFAEEIQTWLVNRMPTTENYGWYLLGAGAAIAAAVGWQITRRSGGTSDGPAPSLGDIGDIAPES
ncbi:MAG: cytochrome c biogenesis CcdA family protein [Ilumatobacter sp.]|uniref:cytochrome c biogenesis CcdA family protein n=1 Tax=Ilumatobacter sp. TaxID=1967498 RepID=UPI00260FB504|nr:cytochrome c biogenesis CcdA family protein [Ilumatobacter sp.]MDJ0768239.1 cytochrome c biogenesis CcdA family protein [Ilumatobacter sp.]